MPVYSDISGILQDTFTLGRNDVLTVSITDNKTQVTLPNDSSNALVITSADGINPVCVIDRQNSLFNLPNTSIARLGNGGSTDIYFEANVMDAALRGNPAIKYSVADLAWQHSCNGVDYHNMLTLGPADAYSGSASTAARSDHSHSAAGLGIATYVHPNHSGDITSVGDGAMTISDHAVTLAKMADMATASVIGRSSTSTGSPEVLSMDTLKTMMGSKSGTWTPTIYGSATNPTLNYVGRTGNYVVVNSLVFINIYISINGVSSAGSGNIRLNLPVGLIPKYNTVGSLIYNNYDRSSANAQLAPQINTDGYIYIMESVDNGSMANSAVTRIRTGTIMHITGTYAI